MTDEALIIPGAKPTPPPEPKRQPSGYAPMELLYTYRTIECAGTKRRMKVFEVLEGEVDPAKGAWARYIGTVMVELPDGVTMGGMNVLPVDINCDGDDPENQTLLGAFGILFAMWDDVCSKIQEQARQAALAGAAQQMPPGWLDNLRQEHGGK